MLAVLPEREGLPERSDLCEVAGSRGGNPEPSYSLPRGSWTLIDVNLVSLSDFGYRVDEESTAPPSGGNVCMWSSIEFQLAD